MSESTPPHSRKEGVGATVGKGLAAATGGLVSLAGKMFGEARKRGGGAVADFRARPEHSRWRAYALGSYGLIVAGTLAGQLYTDNSIKAYVRLHTVDLPASTAVFVRNDSRTPWYNVRLTLNGIFTYEQSELKPNQHIMVPVNKFAIYDQTGRPTFAPKNISPKALSIDEGEQHFETELHE